jgi:hypothetical protein
LKKAFGGNRFMVWQHWGNENKSRNDGRRKKRRTIKKKYVNEKK